MPYKKMGNGKVMTMYQLRGRIAAVMVVIGVMGFILFATQFYGTDRNSVTNFALPSLFNKGGYKFDGTQTVSPTINKTGQGESSSIYAIVFDGGSTGSRVHIFHFHVSQPGGSLELVKEIFKEVKPGLSSYADTPIEAAMSLQNMMDDCLAEIPPTLHSTTPITLKATAGLRLLPAGRADNILNEVTAYFKKFPFQLPQSGVGVMDGVDEGVFSWMTVNFMLGYLTSNTDTVAALDLGGGSTQITFIPKEKSTFTKAPAEFAKNVQLFKQEYSLYTHSYLKLGLMSARFILTGGEKRLEGPAGLSFNLTSPCIPPGVISKWTYSGKDYTVVGANKEEFNIATCEQQAKSLATSLVHPVEELNNREIYIFSYFFDAAVAANLIERTGGVIKVEDYKQAALTAVSEGRTDNPFLVLDLIYSYSLLHHGYHIEDQTKVHLAKKINGVEVSWGLGAAFELLSAQGLAR